MYKTIEEIPSHLIRSKIPEEVLHPDEYYELVGYHKGTMKPIYESLNYGCGGHEALLAALGEYDALV